MSWFAFATTKKNATALVHDGQLYEAPGLGSVAAILADWERHAGALRKAGEALPGKSKALGPAKDNVAAPFRPQRIFCAAANYGEARGAESRADFVHKYRCFYAVSKTVSPRRILELGTHAGSSADASYSWPSVKP